MLNHIQNFYRTYLAPHGPLDLLVLQPTPYCNLACRYCYLSTKDDKRRMSMDTLRQTMKRIRESRMDLLRHGRLSVVWHAGEPMVVGVEYYREALRVIREEIPDNVIVKHSFQTNATLMNDAWCEFIKDNDITIGVSVDGPAFLHDMNRVTRTQRGSHAMTQKGMDLLRKHGIAYHTISVLTREALKHPEAMSEYFVENGVHFLCFNVEEAEGENVTSSLADQATDLELKAFMRYMFKKTSEAGMIVREFEAAERAILSWNRVREITSPYTQEGSPFCILNVDINGAFSSFSPELLGQKMNDGHSFVFGNVHEHSLDSMLDDPRFRLAWAQIRRGIDQCRKSCQYFGLCGGGSPSNKYHENGDFASTETRFCKQHKQLPIQIMLDELEARAAQLSSK